MGQEAVLVSGVLVDTSVLGTTGNPIHKLYGARFTGTADATVLLKETDVNGKVLARMGIEASGERSDDFLPPFSVPVGTGILFVDAGGATVEVTVYFG